MRAHQSPERVPDEDQDSRATTSTRRNRRTAKRGRGAPRFYSVAEAAEVFGTSTVTLYRAIRDGEIPAVRIRGRVIVPAKAIEDLAAVTVRAQDLDAPLSGPWFGERA